MGSLLREGMSLAPLEPVVGRTLVAVIMRVLVVALMGLRVELEGAMVALASAILTAPLSRTTLLS